MPRMSDAEFNAHNDRVAARRLAEYDYRRSLTPERMIREMQESPSHQKFKIFDEEFREMMDAQMTIFGADSVAEKWFEMKTAYDSFIIGESPS
jgi:hypothetical protein